MLSDINANKMQWQCNKCSNSSSTSTSSSQIESVIKKQFDLLKEELLQSINNNFKLMTDRITAFEDRVKVIHDELKSEITQLQEEVAVLKSRVTENSEMAPPVDFHPSEEVFTELEDRQRRAKHLILYNVPESTKVTSDERKLDDLNMCRNLIDDNSVTINKCVRLGRNLIVNKQRPILIKAASSEIILQVLRAYKPRNGIYMSRDLTPRQRNIAQSVRKEFYERKQRGEKNIALKFRNNLPFIVNVGEETKNA